MSGVIFEEWRDVPGYEGLYEVSNLGEVRSLDRITTMKNEVKRITHGKLLKQGKYNSKSNYRGVALCKEGISTKHSVHRLVALAFIPNPENLPEINHKDENKQNNRVDNLEWCDRKYNNTYGTAKLRAAATSGKPVLQLKNGVIVNAWPSQGLAAAFTSASQSGISACLRGECKTSGGYEWELAPWA
jgi:hypothetical protein